MCGMRRGASAHACRCMRVGGALPCRPQATAIPPTPTSLTCATHTHPACTHTGVCMYMRAARSEAGALFLCGLRRVACGVWLAACDGRVCGWPLWRASPFMYLGMVESLSPEAAPRMQPQGRSPVLCAVRYLNSGTYVGYAAHLVQLLELAVAQAEVPDLGPFVRAAACVHGVIHALMSIPTCSSCL